MADLDDVRKFLADEHGLATVSTVQADGRVLSSVVNCCVVGHPVTNVASVALVSGGSAARLGHIRRGSGVTVAIRRGWTWRSVTGRAEIIGPDDNELGLSPDDIRMLLRRIYQAAGGEHDDYEEFDRVMLQDRRAAVFVAPDRILGNG